MNPQEFAAALDRWMAPVEAVLAAAPTCRALWPERGGEVALTAAEAGPYLRAMLSEGFHACAMAAGTRLDLAFWEEWEGALPPPFCTPPEGAPVFTLCWTGPGA